MRCPTDVAWYAPCVDDVFATFLAQPVDGDLDDVTVMVLVPVVDVFRPLSISWIAPGMDAT